MPGMDRSGPRGFGPMTGKGFGPCGKGFRKQFRGGYCNTTLVLTDEQKKQILMQELKDLEIEKQEIEKKLKEM